MRIRSSAKRQNGVSPEATWKPNFPRVRYRRGGGKRGRASASGRTSAVEACTVEVEKHPGKWPPSECPAPVIHSFRVLVGCKWPYIEGNYFENPVELVDGVFDTRKGGASRQ